MARAPRHWCSPPISAFRKASIFSISVGARVDEPNNTGETPLISAVHRRDLGMRALAAEGRRRSRPARQFGRSARDYAILEGKDSAVATEIANAGKGGAQGAKKTYGPSF